MDKIKINKIVMNFILLILLISLVYAAIPQFTNIVANQLFNVSEDENFLFNVTANDSDTQYPLNFTDTSKDDSVNFTVFAMADLNDTTALINFTPTNDDVALYEFHIIVEDTASESNLIKVRFNITNVNDPPNITSFFPTDQTPSIAENTTQKFNYTATDPDLIHGDLLGNRWLLDGVLQDENTSSFNYTPGFCDSGIIHNITLVVYDSSNTNATVEWNVTVTNTNRVPVFNSSKIIVNVSWNEDTNRTNNITLSEFFYDLDFNECTGSNKDNLTYNVTGNINITITINQTTTNVSFIPDKDFAGNETVIFKLNDTFSAAESNNVLLSVNNTNDPPILNFTNETKASVGILFTLQVNATDPDTQYGDILTFSDNSTLFNITTTNSTLATGLINFTPQVGSAGNYSINITVNDTSGIKVSKILQLEIFINSNPVLASIANQTATESQLFELNISATDADNDTLTFTTNFTGFTITTINSTAVKLSFTPNNNDVGNHSIRVNVTDPFEGIDNQTFLLTVIDVNNVPVLSPIGNKTAKINFTFTLIINATDADGDVLIFLDNTTLFDITTTNSTLATGLINFSVLPSQKGNYSINITVRDTSNASDTEIINIEVTENRVPVLDTLTNQTGDTGVLLEFNITATDLDQDALSFSINYSKLSNESLNNTAARFFMTPLKSDAGIHSVNVTVTDGNLSSSGIFQINITVLNHAPFFDSISNKTCTINITCEFNITAFDTDGDDLNFSANLTLLDITTVNTTINSTTAKFNFTPSDTSISNYSVLINVTDGNLTTTTTMYIFINEKPSIDTFVPSSLTVSVAENSSLLFNHTSSDPDNDILTNTWRIAKINDTLVKTCNNQDSTNQSSCESNSACIWYSATSNCEPLNRYISWVNQTNNQSWTYYPGFSDFGNHSVMLLVQDGESNATEIWNVTVTNTNRVATYGKKIHDFNNFTLGTINQTNVTNNIIKLASNDSLFYPSGTFISGTINFRNSHTQMNLTTIEWVSAEPSNTTITFQTRTSSDGSSWSDWSSNTSNGATINSTRNQYLQYKAILSTTDTSVSPNVTRVVINYIIGNKTFNENTIIVEWIDLDDFFDDLDSDDILTYTVTGQSSISVVIDNTTHRVDLRPANNFVGAETITFFLNDGYTTINSSGIKIQTLDVTEQTETTTGGGGGGGAIVSIVPEEVVEELVSFELISPGVSTIYENGTIITPIILRNGANTTLNRINLSAESENKELKLSFTTSFFEKLEVDEEIETELIILSTRTFGSFEVIVKATVEDPVFEDSVKIFISSIEKGEYNKTQINTKLAFTQDLLSENPECLELNEFLEKAREHLNSDELDKANIMLNSVIETCKFFITRGIEKPAKRGFMEIIRNLLRGKEFYILLGLIILTMISTIAYFVHKSKQEK